MKKFLSYIGAFICLLAVFFIAGVCTLGSVRTSGQAMFAQANSAVYFTLVDEDGALNEKPVGSIYVKIGTVYTDVGNRFNVTTGLSTSFSPSTSGSHWLGANKTTSTLVNVYSYSQKKAGANYNWYKVFDGKRENMKALSFVSTVSISLHEIVCLDENGEQIFLKPHIPAGYDRYEASELAKVCDAQDSFVNSSSAYHNFTPEEGYQMTSVETLLGGKEVNSDCAYTLNENFNYLGTIFSAASVAIFGTSVFALRLPAFLATCCLILFAFLLMKDLFKSEKYAFIGSVLLCIGGMATTLGRLGAPYAIVASALVASVYFMHKFFSKGISSKHVFKDGANVLVSGLFAAVALAIDGASIFPVLGILVLFGFGMARQKKAYALALSKVGGTQLVRGKAQTAPVNDETKEITAKYKQKNRVCYGYATLSFLMATCALIFISAVICYSAAIKVNDNADMGFGNLVWYGLKNSILGNGVIPYATQNASNAFAWVLPWKAATIYTGVNGGGDYLAWNVIPNFVVSICAFAALIVTSIKVVQGYANKENSKQALRLRRGYFLLLGGLIASFLTAVLKLHVSPMNAYAFQVFYLMFIPLVFCALVQESNDKKKKILDILLWVIVGLVAVIFLVGLPSGFGFATSANYAKTFQWTCIFSNGIFR